MPSSNQNGTQTATVGTEHALGTAITAAGTYVLSVDTANMANGDILELRCKKKVLTGGTEKVYVLGTFRDAQADPVKDSIPVVSIYSCSFTLKQVTGTGRAFDWNIQAL